MHRSASKRSGFTLIEIMLVIAVIAILATVILPLARSAMNAQKKATATGAIAALSGACERYRKLYGDFPCARSGTVNSTTADVAAFRQDLYLQLTGQTRLRSTALLTGGVGLDFYVVPNGSERPLVTPELVDACTAAGVIPSPMAIKTCTEFVDPWGNAYDYRYRVLNTASTSTTTANSIYTVWYSPDFLLVSCGAKYKASVIPATPHVPLLGEYWDLSNTASMIKNGAIPTTYFDDYITNTGPGVGLRADNITNWSGR